MPAQANHPAYQDETSLGELILKVLRFYRRFGVSLALLSAVVAIALAVWVSFRPLFSVTAILDTPELSLDEWRRIEPLLADRRLVAASLATHEARDTLEERFSRPLFWTNSVRYRAALRRDDINSAPNIDLRNTSTLGLELNLRADDDESARVLLEAMTGHIREALLWSRLRGFLQDTQEAVARRSPKLQEALLEKRFAIGQEQRRIEDMRQLLAAYPELREATANTMISVQEGGGRYLSPLAQIVALEVSISEARSEMDGARRGLDILGLYSGFLDGAADALQGAHSGSRLAAALREAANALVATAGADAPLARAVAESIDMQVSSALMQTALLRLKAIPQLPDTPVNTRRPALVAIASFLAVLAALSVILATGLALRRLAGPADQP